MLCEKYHRDFSKTKHWYDGYLLEQYQVYNPKAVVELMIWNKFQSYWSDTGTYEAIVPLINMDFDGLKTAIIEMLSGNSAEIDPTTFQNDMVNFTCRDDILTCLIHLGYLGYDQDTHSAFVPNEEIRQELAKAVKRKKWNEFLTFQQESSELLDATLDMDTDTVARSIEKYTMNTLQLFSTTTKTPSAAFCPSVISALCGIILNLYVNFLQAEVLQILSTFQSQNIPEITLHLLLS